MALSLAAGSPSAAAPAHANRSATATSATLSVLEWNVDLLASSVDTVENLKAGIRTPRIQTILRKHPADVVILNELFNHDSTASIETALADLYPYHTPVVGQSCSVSAGWQSVAGNCSSSPFIMNGGTVMLSKYPIESQHELVYNDSTSWDWWANKGAALARINKNGTRAWVAGTHLQADQAGTSLTMTRQIRLAQLAQLRNWTNSVAGMSGPVLLGGDLNVEYYAGAAGRAAGDSDYDRAQAAVNGALSTSAQGIQPVATIDCTVSAWCRTMSGVESFPSNYLDDVDYLGYLRYTSGGKSRPVPSILSSVTSLFDPQAGWVRGSLDTFAPSDHYPLSTVFAVG